MSKLEDAAATLTHANEELPYLLSKAQKLRQELAYIETTIKNFQTDRELAFEVLQDNKAD